MSSEATKKSFGEGLCLFVFLVCVITLVVAGIMKTTRGIDDTRETLWQEQNDKSYTSQTTDGVCRGVNPPHPEHNSYAAECHNDNAIIYKCEKNKKTTEITGLIVVRSACTDRNSAFLLVLTCYFMSTVLGLALIVFLRMCPFTTIISTNIMSIVLWCGVAVYAFARSEGGTSLAHGWVSVLFAVCSGVFLILSGTLRFSSSCLQLAASLAITNYGVILVSLLQCSLLCGLAIAAWQGAVETGTATVQYGKTHFWIIVIVFFWANEVVKSCVACTVAPVVHGWFHGEPVPVKKSLLSTMTSASGSVCYGSLFVGPVRMIKALGDLISYPAHAVLAHFNDYGFVRVAVFKEDFHTASRKTWDLVRLGTSFNAVIQDSLLTRVFLSLASLSGPLSGTACLLHSDGELQWFWFGVFMGFIFTGVYLKVVYSGVLTVFIAYWQLQIEGTDWATPSLPESIKTDFNALLKKKFSGRGSADEEDEVAASPTEEQRRGRNVCSSGSTNDSRQELEMSQV